MGRLSKAWPVVAPCLLLFLAWLAAWMVGSCGIQREVTQMLVYVVLVVGYYIFAGNSGVLSFGHMSFMAVGAYVTALLTIPPVLKDVVVPDLPEFLAEVHLARLPGGNRRGLCAAAFASFSGFRSSACRASGGALDVRGAGDRARGDERLGRGHRRAAGTDGSSHQHDQRQRARRGDAGHRRRVRLPAIADRPASACSARSGDHGARERDRCGRRQTHGVRLERIRHRRWRIPVQTARVVFLARSS